MTSAHSDAERRRHLPMDCDDAISALVPTACGNSSRDSFIVVRGRVLDRSDSGLRFTCDKNIEETTVWLKSYRDGVAESYLEGEIVSAHQADDGS